MSHNYRITIRFDGERRQFVAQAPEVPLAVGEGATRAEAIARAEEEMEAVCATLTERGEPLPVPLDERAFAEPLTLPLSATMRRELEAQARADGIEVAQLASELLAAALTQRQAPFWSRRAGSAGAEAREPGGPAGGGSGRGDRGREGGGRGPGGRREGYGQRYHNIMEDRASFLEYVRGLEHAGSSGAGGGRPGQGRPGPRRDRDRPGHGGPAGQGSHAGSAPPASKKDPDDSGNR
jgi:predicted RNase H-like HicB family nuclease